ncbi:6450_t:CDS:2, partial [Diversispora eburnea]
IKKKVIVHNVKPSDTLAGVALFYGIELSILKKANKLWTNDSIHMRKYLNIPLEDCTITEDETNVMVQDDHITIVNQLLNVNNTYNDNSSNSSFTPNLISATDSNSSNGTTTGTTVVTHAEIHQLPSSQLSYFPSPRHQTTTTIDSKTSNSTNSSFFLSPSPIPVSYINKKDSNNIVDKLLVNLNNTNNNNPNYKDKKGFVDTVKKIVGDKRKIRNNYPELEILLVKKKNN